MEDALDGIEQLLAERQVGQLLARYAHALDYGDVEDFVDCFHPDAVYEIHYPDHVDPSYIPVRGGRLGSERTLIYDGVDQLRGFSSAHTHAPQVLHKHAALMPLFEWQAVDQVIVRSCTLRLDIASDTTAFIRAFGRYVDEVVQRDGQWRFLRRRAEVQALNSRSILAFA